MRLTCPTCGASYDLAAASLPEGGGHVQCSACHTRWFVHPEGPPPAELSEDEIITRLAARGSAAPPAPAAEPDPLPGPEAGTAELAEDGEADAAFPAAAPIPFPGPARPAQEPPPPPRPADALDEPDATFGVDAEAPSGVAPATATPATFDPVTAAPATAAPATAAPAAAAPSTISPSPVSPMSRPARDPLGQPAGPLRPRARSDRPPAVPASEADRPGGGRGWLGALVALTIAGGGLALYLHADAAAARAPMAARAIEGYAAGIDSARRWIETRLGPLRDSVAGG